jgi:hypothetical protein
LTHSKAKIENSKKQTNPAPLKSKLLEVKLWTCGCEWMGLKLPAKIQLLKQDIKEKEEHVGGVYDIGIVKYFKLV